MEAQVFNRNISPAITEQLCKTVVAHEERAKSLKDLIRAAMANPSPYLPLPNVPHSIGGLLKA
jgi:hypothetical protein